MAGWQPIAASAAQQTPNPVARNGTAEVADTRAARQPCRRHGHCVPHLPSLYLAAILAHSPATTAGHAYAATPLLLLATPTIGNGALSTPGPQWKPSEILGTICPWAHNADAVALPDRGKLLSLGSLELRLTVT